MHAAQMGVTTKALGRPMLDTAIIHLARMVRDEFDEAVEITQPNRAIGELEQRKSERDAPVIVLIEITPPGQSSKSVRLAEQPRELH